MKEEAMSENDEKKLKRRLDPENSSRILSASAVLIGVCLTALGLIRITISLQRKNTIADDLLALDAVLFLASFFFSYWALRYQGVPRPRGLERAADIVFMIGLVFLVLICLYIVYMISVP